MQQQKMTVYFATDHAGFELKNELVDFVRDELKYTVVDCGAEVYDENDDFTQFIAKAVREVAVAKESVRAVILGGSGQGEAMLANRFHGVRAVVYYGGTEEIIRLSRVHNDANVLSLGARFLKSKEAKAMVKLWLETAHVPVEKYDRRIADMEIESKTTDGPVISFDGALQGRSLVPSLPAKSFAEIETLLNGLRGVAKGVQIDIVDGVFVPHVSWPFTELHVPSALLQLAVYKDDLEIEVDCMCMYPQQYLDTLVALGAQRVIVHMGTTEKLNECIAHARKHEYKIGLGILNSTPHDKLGAYASDIDFVQVMGIERIGIQGQAFDEKTLETIAYIKSTYPDLEIAVDGAVNADTIPRLLKAGAVRFAPGSAISKAKDSVHAYRQLARLIGI